MDRLRDTVWLRPNRNVPSSVLYDTEPPIPVICCDRARSKSSRPRLRVIMSFGCKVVLSAPVSTKKFTDPATPNLGKDTLALM